MPTIRHIMRAVLARAFLTLAATAIGIRLINAVYRRLPSSARELLQSRFAGLYRDGRHRLASGVWVVDFVGREVRLPLRTDRAWLDWDAALSALGHEPQVKTAYQTLLTGPDAPDLFVDIGANYGVHSLLFLVAGVETITFEPNDSCHEFFREACALNGVTPRLERAALGESEGELDLYFPERETWLGSIDPETVARLKSRPGVRHRRVPVHRLDDYLERFAGRRALIKIDAEDHEPQVLRGALAVLQQHRPRIVFECHVARRAPVYDVLQSQQYDVAHLPAPGRRLERLGHDEFLAAGVDDFFAYPRRRETPG